MFKLKNTKKITILLIVLCGCFCLNTYGFTESGNNKEEESLYSQSKRAIVRLEHSVEYREEGSQSIKVTNKPDGTAFFVRYKKSLYIVTARHVVDRDYDLHVRVPVIYAPKENKDNQEAEKQGEVVLMKLPRSGWIFHPEGGNDKNRYVDIAAMKIWWAKERSIVHFIYLDKDDPDFKDNQLPDVDPVPPKEMMVFGFPLDIGFGLKEQRPFGRKGIVSFISEEEHIKDSSQKYFDKKCFIVDVESFPGNSGSPIMNFPSPFENKVLLLGIVIASNDKQSFSIAEPASRIRELLDFADKDTREPFKVWRKMQSVSGEPVP